MEPDCETHAFMPPTEVRHANMPKAVAMNKAPSRSSWTMLASLALVVAVPALVLALVALPDAAVALLAAAVAWVVAVVALPAALVADLSA
jgi:hypothetical protein